MASKCNPYILKLFTSKVIIFRLWLFFKHMFYT
nr:MAG TPA: hypothetical protein [Bacteriophage sp.]